MVTIDFYLGIGSRYSYLAASQVARIERRYDCEFVWKPIASGVLIDRRDGNPFRGAPAVGQYEPAYRERDARSWASHYGIPFREPLPFKVEATAPARACLAAGNQGALMPCCQALQRLVFVDGVALDDAVVASLPARLGLDATSFRRDLDAAETRTRHEALIDEAERRGAFGVPTFFLGERMFWGNDRLVLLEGELARGEA